MRSFLKKIDNDRVVAAIRSAEEKTSGQIRVHLHHRRAADPLAAGGEIFEKLGMSATKHRDGVLIFVAPRSKTFAILGDTGIHQKCGDEFWKSAVEKLSGHFRGGRFSDGLIASIEELGRVLAQHFPAEPGAANELPDEIDEG